MSEKQVQEHKKIISWAKSSRSLIPDYVYSYITDLDRKIQYWQSIYYSSEHRIKGAELEVELLTEERDRYKKEIALLKAKLTIKKKAEYYEVDHELTVSKELAMATSRKPEFKDRNYKIIRKLIQQKAPFRYTGLEFGLSSSRLTQIFNKYGRLVRSNYNKKNRDGSLTERDIAYYIDHFYYDATRPGRQQWQRDRDYKAAKEAEQLHFG